MPMMTRPQEKVIDITMKIADLQVQRILAMSDDEIMVEAIREYGSPAAAQEAVERTRQGVLNAIDKWKLNNLRKFMSDEQEAK